MGVFEHTLWNLVAVLGLYTVVVAPFIAWLWAVRRNKIQASKILIAAQARLADCSAEERLQLTLVIADAEKAISICTDGLRFEDHSYTPNPEEHWGRGKHYLAQAVERWEFIQPRVPRQARFRSSFRSALALLRPQASACCTNCSQPVTRTTSGEEPADELRCPTCSSA